MEGYIASTDARWLKFLTEKGIDKPVFWFKRASSPNRNAIIPGNLFFFRITKSKPPVISGFGFIQHARTITLAEAFQHYGERLGYPSIAKMMESSSTWTSGVKLAPSTEIFCVEIRDFHHTQDLRVDTDLSKAGINFDFQHIVTGKGVNEEQARNLHTLLSGTQGNEIQSIVTSLETTTAPANEFDPKSVADARERTAALIARRRGQPEFRRKLIKAYNSECTMSGCDAIEALEAAHITPYRGPDTNHLTNGLLLRADLHVLFDLGLIAVDSHTMEIIVHENLLGTTYSELHGKRLRLPKVKTDWPSTAALDAHRMESGL